MSYIGMWGNVHQYYSLDTTEDQHQWMEELEILKQRLQKSEEQINSVLIETVR